MFFFCVAATWECVGMSPRHNMALVYYALILLFLQLFMASWTAVSVGVECIQIDFSKFAKRGARWAASVQRNSFIMYKSIFCGEKGRTFSSIWRLWRNSLLSHPFLPCSIWPARIYSRGVVSSTSSTVEGNLFIFACWLEPQTNLAARRGLDRDWLADPSQEMRCCCWFFGMWVSSGSR